MTRSVLSGVSAKGRDFPSRDGRLPANALRRPLPRPNPSFDGGICELLDVLRGLPTSASSSEIRAAIRSIFSCCAGSSSCFSASVRT